MTATKFARINLNKDKCLSWFIKPAQAFSVLPRVTKHSCKSVVFIQSLRNPIEHPLRQWYNYKSYAIQSVLRWKLWKQATKNCGNCLWIRIWAKAIFTRRLGYLPAPWRSSEKARMCQWKLCAKSASASTAISVTLWSLWMRASKSPLYGTANMIQ